MQKVEKKNTNAADNIKDLRLTVVYIKKNSGPPKGFEKTLQAYQKSQKTLDLLKALRRKTTKNSGLCKSLEKKLQFLELHSSTFMLFFSNILQRLKEFLVVFLFKALKRQKLWSSLTLQKCTNTLENSESSSPNESFKNRITKNSESHKNFQKKYNCTRKLWTTQRFEKKNH